MLPPPPPPPKKKKKKLSTLPTQASQAADGSPCCVTVLRHVPPQVAAQIRHQPRSQALSSPGAGRWKSLGTRLIVTIHFSFSFSFLSATARRRKCNLNLFIIQVGIQLHIHTCDTQTTCVKEWSTPWPTSFPGSLSGEAGRETLGTNLSGLHVLSLEQVQLRKLKHKYTWTWKSILSRKTYGMTNLNR